MSAPPEEPVAVLPDVERGHYRKFAVSRIDGSSGEGKKHEHCEFFVLDIEHDPFAPAALRAYAQACLATHPTLAKDLIAIANARVMRAAVADAAEEGTR